jgi:exopolysaccharide biosynthesis polyprenyl glycosylphosphotransferase
MKTKRSSFRLRDSERRLILVIGDFMAASLATLGALYFWAQFDWFGFSVGFLRFRAVWFILLPAIWVLLMVNLYDPRKAADLRETIKGIIIAAGAGVVLYLVVYFTTEPGSLPRRGVMYFLILVTLLTLLWRMLYIRLFTMPAFMRRVLIVGAGENGSMMVEIIQAQAPPPFILVGLIDDDPAKKNQQVNGIPVLGDNRNLISVIRRADVSDLIVAIMGPMQGEMFQAILDAQQMGVEVTRLPVAYEELLGRVPIQRLESDWLLRSFVDELRVSGVYNVSKRLVDLIGSALGLFLLLIFLPFIAVAILLESGRPIFFLQKRLGRGGNTFEVLKFRTMLQDAEADGSAHWAQEEDPRATKVGKVLRRTHMDEFPQFWNVLRGEMSLVGPRPERPELVAELEQEIPFYRARLLVKPGIGGWAQVNYGKGASIQGSAEKLEYDLYYIKHRNLMLDFWIVLRSIGRAIGFTGV